jgi:hypothetical protein
MITRNKKRHLVNKLSALSCPVLLAKLDKEIPRKHYKLLDISNLITLYSGFWPNSCFIVAKANQLHHLGCDGLVQLRFSQIINRYRFACQGVFYEFFKKN